jgi:hypothetical protein
MSLSHQDCVPDEIQLWVSHDSYLRDDGICEDHPLILEIKQVFPLVDVRWTENTGPYRKLLPALQGSSDSDIVIIVDDDVIYGRYWLKGIMDEHRRYPESVIATRVREVRKNKVNRETTYLQWPLVRENRLLKANFVITGAGGVLFRKRFFKDIDIANKDFVQICPTADDLWFSRILEKNGIGVRCFAKGLSEIFFMEHKEGLVLSNTPNLNTRVKQFLFWLLYKRLGNLGFSICKNDVLYKDTREYFKNSSEFEI